MSIIIPGIEKRVETKGELEMVFMEGRATLDAWKGFQSRQGPYTSIDEKGISDGSIRVQIGGDEAMPADFECSEEQLKAYNSMMDNQEAIRDSILDILFQNMDGIREQYQEDYDLSDEEVLKYIPKLNSKEDLKGLMGLGNVHILNLGAEDMAFTGYEFGCNWDEEHGMGVLVHGIKVLEIGESDTAFVSWMAKKHIEAGW